MSRPNELVGQENGTLKPPGLDEVRKSLESRTRNSSNFSRQRYKSFLQDTIPPCSGFRTRSSVDHYENPIEFPKPPSKYKPPFRRNFRYFGYPEDLNPALNTPPRVRSWGPFPEPCTRAKGKRVPFRASPDEHGFDPYWIGRLMKSCLLLNTPGLLPVVDKAVMNLGEERIHLSHPDFEHTNCTSELYFPLSEKSRQAFCRINKICQGIFENNVHNYSVQNPTNLKNKRHAREVKSYIEQERKSKLGFQSATQDRASNFALTDFRTKGADIHYYLEREVPAVMKTFCIPENYPGINKQLYARPRFAGEGLEEVVAKEYIKPATGIARVAAHQLNIPEDVWAKLSKVRARRQQLEKIRINKRGRQHRTFDQLELRNHVMAEARRHFINQIKHQEEAPLPPELYEDNRKTSEPPHDYVGKGEFPPQGPFWWKVDPEAPPTPQELKIIEQYVADQKDQHHNTHHLPGLLYMPRHPFPQMELDWMEKDAEVDITLTESRKTPAHWQDLPPYLIDLDPKGFEEKFSKVVSEGAKDLVGPEMYELYRMQHGLKSPTMSENESVQEIPKPQPVTSKKKVLRKRERKVQKPTISKMPVLPDEDDDEGEGEEEEGEEEEDEYRLDEDLDNEEIFPLPDVRFSSIEFPKEGIPIGLKEDLKFFKREVERATPIKKEEEETNGVDDDRSNTSTSSEEDFVEPRLSHDPVSHLQVLYQDAVKSKYKSIHRHMKDATELDPPRLKDVFLMEDFAEDIEHLLEHGEKVPKFLQLF